MQEHEALTPVARRSRSLTQYLPNTPATLNSILRKAMAVRLSGCCAPPSPPRSRGPPSMVETRLL